MNAIDLTPLYRSSVGFDRLGTLINHALTSDSSASGYPSYNIEVLDKDRYEVALAVSGFSQDDLDIQVEQGVLTVRGEKQTKDDRKYLYQGIANRSFERKFNLADHVKVTSAEMDNGLLTISLVQEVPEAMKPKTIAINQKSNVLEHSSKSKKSNTDQAA